MKIGDTVYIVRDWLISGKQIATAKVINWDNDNVVVICDDLHNTAIYTRNEIYTSEPKIVR